MDPVKIAGHRKTEFEKRGLCYKIVSFAMEVGLCMSVLGSEGSRDK